MVVEHDSRPEPFGFRALCCPSAWFGHGALWLVCVSAHASDFDTAAPSVMPGLFLLPGTTTSPSQTAGERAGSVNDLG